MKIAETYSHLNGLEFLLVHEPGLWDELRQVIASVDAEECKTKVSKEKTMRGKALYSPVEMNNRFKQLLRRRGWEESRVSYWVTRNEELARKTVAMPPDEQKKEIAKSGETPILCEYQTDFLKERIGIEAQFAECAFAACGLFAKHLAFFVGDKIDVGIEILPMKSLQKHMSSGVAYYEGEFYNVVRQGRGVPAVPLVILGVEP